MGQAIGVVAAETEAQARAAAKAVVVEYEDLPALLDIDDAIAGRQGVQVGGRGPGRVVGGRPGGCCKRLALPPSPPPHAGHTPAPAAKSFIEPWGHSVASGDVDAALAGDGAEHVIEGEARMGGQVRRWRWGCAAQLRAPARWAAVASLAALPLPLTTPHHTPQEHFYLEPNASIVIPGEADEFVSYSSTQVRPRLAWAPALCLPPRRRHVSHAYALPLPCRAPFPGPHSPPPPAPLQCPDKHQKYIAHVLGVPQHKVVVRTKRLGER